MNNNSSPLEKATQTRKQQRIKELNDLAYSDSEKLNELSAEYRKVMHSIGDRLIVLAAGSITLELTFIGVLYSSARNSSALEYKLILISMILFLISIVIVLTSKWTSSVKLYYQGAVYYYQTIVDLEKAKTGNINLTKIEDYSLGKSPEFRDYLKSSDVYQNKTKLMLPVEMMVEELNKIKGKVRTYTHLSKWSSVIAWVCFVLGYIFALGFFIGVMLALNSP